MRKRKALYVNRVSSGLTVDMNRNLIDLQRKTGKSKASLIREAINLLISHYRKLGY